MKRNTLPTILPFILLILSLQIVKELLKFIYEKWTYSLFIINAVTNTISIIILFFIKNKLWNENFIGELLAQRVIIEGSDSFNTITILWEQLTFWIIVLSIIGLFIDIIVTFFKIHQRKK